MLEFQKRGEFVETFSVVAIVLTIAALILFWFAISALIQLKKTLESIDTLAGNVDNQLMPLLTDLHEAVNKVNTELNRIDEIVLTVRDIGEKVNATTRVVHEIISSPLIKVASVSAGAKEAVRKLVSRK